MKINVMKVMKHRYPFLMIDKVISYEYLKNAKVLKNITYNEPWAQGHYPVEPIFPGVLMIEAMGQACAFMLMDFELGECPKTYGYLTTVEYAKFVRPVLPGDQLVMTCELIEKVDNFIKASVISTVQDRVVGKCKLTFILKEVVDG